MTGSNATRVGSIGLGIMGRPCALNLIAAGHELTVTTRTKARATEVLEAGATWADTPAEVAGGVEIVFLNLPDTPDVDQVLFGESGISAAEGFGGLVIDMSTIDPGRTVEIAAELSGRGIGFVDAPVSGGEKGAIEGNLSVMAGGSEADLARALPLLEVVGQRITHVGPAGAGQMVKACNQLLVGSNLMAIAEAMVLAERSGLVSAAAMREAVTGGFADSRCLQVHGQRMVDRAFEPGFKSDLHAKDARIVEQMAAQTGTPIEAFDVARKALDHLVETGRGEMDDSAVIEVVRERADGKDETNAAGAKGTPETEV
ncbi:MAG: NAD(P)-dependent oxidoreductase [Solirubrobacterales bacterium]|nr:NAD(P)-dependent oxidoreductase [Solirubrobacterales bacterium]MCB8914734.1 NAD(P)-dependent oxidoreductase [Thermoleophilales bacterium]